MLVCRVGRSGHFQGVLQPVPLKVSALEVHLHVAFPDFDPDGGEYDHGDDGQHRAVLEDGFRKHGLQQHIGRGVQEESELVGGETAARTRGQGLSYTLLCA